MISVRFQRGIELPDLGFWLDPADPQPFAFVSHAHSDHIGRHERVICSEATARLMEQRIAVKNCDTLPFGQETAYPGFKITLIPAGHILGSAQALLETEAGSLLYTGDFKLRQGKSAEPAESRQADTLVMETTFGLPRYRFPPTKQIMEEMVEFCQEALAESAVPILLGYSLGKAQEILCTLADAGLKPMLHESVFRMTHLYTKLRPGFPCEYERYHADRIAGHVLICPPSVSRSIMVQRIKNRRVAMLTGWACDPSARYRYGCDAAFPLSDHADYDDLLRYVELVNPSRVLTVHGFAAEFARDLRQRGIEAWALAGENQMELQLGNGPVFPVSSAEVKETALAGDGTFSRFALVCEEISKTGSRLAKIGSLAEFLASLQSETALSTAALFLTGRANRNPLQAGWAVIKRAIIGASGISEARFREIAHYYSDAGKTAFDALQGRPATASFNLEDAARLFEELRGETGSMAKTASLQNALGCVRALEGQYLVKILTGDLRIGLKEGLVEEAIATAFRVPAEEVRYANMLTGDIGEVAVHARKGTLPSASIQLFRPVKCMLASPEPTANAIWSRFYDTGAEFVLEDKLDGIRAQLHRSADRVEIFTRDLKRVSGQFPELIEAAAHISAEIILDGEIIAFDQGRPLPFFELQKRLGRKLPQPDFFLSAEIPVVYAAFDLLWINGESLLARPLKERRERLAAITFPERVRILAETTADSAGAIDAEFLAARRRYNEGLVAKDIGSLYTPGRRGLAWLKLKKELATLDVIVVGAETGHGKRSQVLSDYTFAVRHDITGEFLTIGKAYSGLTDEEIEELTAHFGKTTRSQHGRYREVEPGIVLEIAFDSVQLSDRHTSGLALRFPRIKAIRRDKTPGEIDTLSYAKSLVAGG